MPVKVRNPYAVSPVLAKAAQHGPAIDAWLKANTGNKLVGLAELRAALPAVAPDLSREVFNQVCANLGLTITNPDDTEA